MVPATLFARSMLIMMTPVVLAQAIATFVFYDRHWDTMTNRLANSVAGEIALVIEQMSRDGDEKAREETLSMAARHTDILFTWTAGEVLDDPPARLYSGLEETLGQALDDRVRRPWRINSNVAHKWIEIRVQMPDGVLSVLSPERRLYSFTSYLFIIWMLGSSLVLFSIATLFMRNQIRPIRRLAVAADAFGKGRDISDFRPEGALEVRQAAHAFLLMRDRIRRQIAQRTEMLAGVSHDLRTPLTRMKLQLAMMPDMAEVEEIKADVAEMQVMIDGYLSFARGDGEEEERQVDLSLLLAEIAGNARREGARLTLDPMVTQGDAVILPLRLLSLRRCLTNLIGNAARYGRHVWLSLERRGNFVEILIDDDGPGIPEDQREAVFRPFHRLEPSRNQKTGGVGLGLTIARDIARRHGGDILLRDSPQKGLRAVVRLPL
ncbi:two-component sensor histidine kinase [Niveispirillum cyanobacteriorum]|uniref:histidine kinase n=2 Tax=Niveispirillum cyanobacteriorum TaxID=1612173 RepID=A0A2K9N928_9PROT|nr:two-component sensor histidine kinase [Niveispirillum cyanobacteriorum]